MLDGYWVLHEITDRKHLFTQDYRFINMKHLCNIGWSSKQFVKTDYMVEIKNLAWEYGTAWIVSKDQLMKIIDADPFYFRNLDRSRLSAGYYAISVVEEID